MYGCAAKWSNPLGNFLDRTEVDKNNQYEIVKFEDVLDNLRSVSKNLCGWLCGEFSENMPEHHKHTDRKVDGRKIMVLRLIRRIKTNGKNN